MMRMMEIDKAGRMGNRTDTWSKFCWMAVVESTEGIIGFFWFDER